MSSEPLTNIGALLKNNSLIKGMLSKAEQQLILKRRVDKLLPASVRHHCMAALMDEDRLLIYADSSVWASRLRYFSRKLKSQLREQGMEVTKITVRVMLDNPILKKNRHFNPPVVTSANAELIQQAAAAIADPELRAALQRLGKRVYQKA